MALGVLSLHGHFGIKQSQSFNLDILFNTNDYVWAAYRYEGEQVQKDR